MWKGTCFLKPLQELTDAEFRNQFNRAPNKKADMSTGITSLLASITVSHWPEFTVTAWDHAANPPADDGLYSNQCWPSGIAAGDPGFALLNFDPWYKGRAPPYDYRKPYVQGANGS